MDMVSRIKSNDTFSAWKFSDAVKETDVTVDHLENEEDDNNLSRQQTLPQLVVAQVCGDVYVHRI